MNERSRITFGTVQYYFNSDFEYGIHRERTEKRDEFSCVLPRFLGEPEETQDRTAHEADIDKLRRINALGYNIFMRPKESTEPYYLMLDDIKNIDKHVCKPGRLIIETSPDNFQIWIKSNRPLLNEEKMYWIRKAGADTGASPKKRWGRAPDFSNRKAKYAAIGFPWVRLITCTSGNASIPVITVDAPVIQTNNDFFDAGKYRNINRSMYDKGDDSRTDFAFALALMVRGATDDYIENRIREERGDFHRNEGQISRYLMNTILKARKSLKRTP